jgi:putative transcriptional regulator
MNLAEVTHLGSPAYVDYNNRCCAAGRQTDRGFVLHTPQGRGIFAVLERHALTTSRDILDAREWRWDERRGCARLCWSAGQLEDEMAHNAWLTAPADARVVFETPLGELAAARRLLGWTAAPECDAGHA